MNLDVSQGPLAISRLTHSWTPAIFSCPMSNVGCHKKDHDKRTSQWQSLKILYAIATCGGQEIAVHEELACYGQPLGEIKPSINPEAPSCCSAFSHIAIAAFAWSPNSVILKFLVVMTVRVWNHPRGDSNLFRTTRD